MSSFHHVARTFLYAALGIFSVVLMGLCAARIQYTTHLPRGDPLNGGRNFYDPIVAELLVCSILGMLWSPLMLYIIHAQREYRFLSKAWQEFLVLAFLWLLFIVGAGVATHIWPNLPSFCSEFKPCRILTAMLAFAWLSWIAITVLLFEALAHGMVNSSFNGPAHGYWGRDEDNVNRRMSEASQYSIRV